MATATLKRSSRSRVSRPSLVAVHPSTRIYAVGMVERGRITRIVEQHITIGEAAAFCRSYNELAFIELDANAKAVIVPCAVVDSIVDGAKGRPAKGGK